MYASTALLFRLIWDRHLSHAAARAAANRLNASLAAAIAFRVAAETGRGLAMTFSP
jgi:hypothetical protein